MEADSKDEAIDKALDLAAADAEVTEIDEEDEDEADDEDGG